MDEKKSGPNKAYLTSVGAWALAFGCSVGWGAFVMPGSTFLPIAGPVGAAVGLGAGALIMFVLAVNFHFLMKRFSGGGGTYTYTKKSFGYDQGFLSAWFLILTYIAIIWANATALPLIARTLFGDTFQFGFHYEIAGFQIYMGEIILAIAALLIAAFVCLKRTVASGMQIVMAVILFVGVVVCFAAAMGKAGNAPAPLFEPPYSPEQSSFGGTFTIFALAPWAYVGFESISHSTGEAKFSFKKTFGILAVALVTAGLAYMFLSLLSASILPEGCSSWIDYIFHLEDYSGVAAQPAFYAAFKAMGNAGSVTLGLAALGAIFTGLIGNYIALSRLLDSMSEDKLLPPWFGKKNSDLVPRNSIFTILIISVILPFFGRTAISWIVDVTTVGATIAYAFASASAWKTARKEKNRPAMVFGMIGMVVALLFAVEFLVPNILSVTTLSTESYLILAIWAILGFIYFYFALRKDTDRKLGRSTVAWIVLLGLVIFTASVWMRQNVQHAEANNPEMLDTVLLDSVLTQVAFITVTLVILFVIYSKIQKREKQIEVEKVVAEESSRAKTSFLSNMSHEIRTPMNAIIGLDNIALRNPDLDEKTREHLEKIGTSAKHLLGLINDILDMSRIESGRVSLKKEEFSLQEFLDQINIIINGQCSDKGLNYTCKVIGDVNDYYIGDDMKMKQVIINILGNAVKFTEAPGDVTFTVEQTEQTEEECTLRFVMKDTGIGMDPEFIPKIFDTFSQEDEGAANRYGSTGLGMAITKNFVEMMDGDILVESEKGVGSTFTITLRLGASDRVFRPEEEENDRAEMERILAGRRILMAEDVDENAEILADLLELEDIESERAENGQIAVEMFREKEPGYYDAILMDVRMPVLDGLGATEAIRALDHPAAKTIPILAMTANVFDEDVERSFSAGMNAHLSKPIEPDRLYETLARFIKGESEDAT